jgi:DNA-binding NarL/FixJ family response regulator
MSAAICDDLLRESPDIFWISDFGLRNYLFKSVSREISLAVGDDWPKREAPDLSMCETVLKKEVVVMEDSPAAKEAIKEVMEGELGWKITITKNSDEVAEYAKNKKAGIYILDNKIGDNPTEGLEALAKLKAIDENIIVAICSAYPKYERQARNIDKNLVTYQVKGIKLKDNFCHIAIQFIERLQQIIDKIQSEVENSSDEYRNITLALLEERKLELERDRQKLEQLLAKNTSATLSIPTDIDGNFEAYEKCQSDREWLAKYESKYVAFVGGEQVFPEITDEQELLKLIRENYPKQRRLFTKVTKSGKTRVVKAPSGYSKIKKI